MNALKRWTFGGWLLLAMLATGCVAQVGQDNADPGGSSEQPMNEPANIAPAARQQQTHELRDVHLTVLKNSAGDRVVEGTPKSQELRVGGGDPGAPVQDDGDGREPQPQPWHGDNLLNSH